MADEAEIDVIVRLKKEGNEAILALKEDLRSIKESLRELQKQAEQTNRSLGEISASSAAAAAALEALNLANGRSASSSNANAAATSEAAQASEEAAAASEGFAGGMNKLVLAALPAVGLVLALSPMLVALAGYIYVTTVYLIGAVTVVATFTAGLLATAGILALALGAFGALSVAVLLLTERFSQAGKVMADPLLGLEKNLGKMADAWGRQAAPMAREIVAWLDALIPRISRAGSELLKWFGDRLPAVLKFATDAINILTGAWDKLRPVLEPILDMVIKHAPEWLAFFQTIVDIGVQAINALLQAFVQLSNWFGQRLPTMAPIVEHVMSRIGDAFEGLTTNLGKLSDWFIDRLPGMEVIANEAFGGMGQVIQAVGQAAGKLVDWFIANWPEIRKNAADAFKAMKEGWDSIAPAFQVLLPLALVALSVMMDGLTKHSQTAHDMLYLLGAVVAIVGVAALIAVAFIAQFVKGISEIDSMAHSAWQKISDLVDMIGQLRGAVANPIAIIIAIAAKVNSSGSGGGGGNNPGGGPVFVPGAGAGGGGGGLISMDTGGIVPGAIGAPMLAIIHGGERVIPFGEKDGAGNQYVVTFNINGVSDPGAVAAEVDRRMAYLLTLT